MKARTHYETLGVSPSASEDEIKQAYRKLARAFHPDKNQGDPGAEERFKEVGEAFEVLSDPTKRRLYDELGDDAAHIGWDPDKAETYRRWAQPGSGQGGKGGEGVRLEDLFAGFESPRGRAASPRAGADVTTRMQIGFEESVRGGTRQLRLDKPVACRTCAGSGDRPGGSVSRCGHCGGSGQMRLSQVSLQFGVPCPACSGTGEGPRPPCGGCAGQGAVTEEVRLDVRIPPGVRDGQKIRLGGQGAPGRGGPPGDLYIQISVSPHPYLRRRDRDLSLDVPVTVPEALRGAEIEVPTLDGPVKLRVPPGTQTGAKLRLRGKGVPGHGRHPAGDLYAVLQVRMPEAGADAEAVEELARGLDALYTGPVRGW